MSRNERRFVSMVVFAVILAVIVLVTNYLVSSSVTLDEMNQIENRALEHAKYCLAMNYEPSECK